MLFFAMMSLMISFDPSTVTSPASDRESRRREESMLFVFTLPSTMPEQTTLGRTWFLEAVQLRKINQFAVSSYVIETSLTS